MTLCPPPALPLLLLCALSLLALRAAAFSLVSKGGCAGRRLVPSQPTDCGGDDASLHFSLRVVRVNRTHFGLSGAVHVRKAIGPPLTQSNPSTCRTMVNMKAEDVCGRLDDKGSLWDDFIENMKGADGSPFPRTCPLPAGNYSLSNYMLKENDLCVLYAFKGHWSYKTEIPSSGCFSMNMEVADA